MKFLECIFKKLLVSRPTFWEKYGIQVTYDHFYYPIPSSRDLTPAFFRRVSEGLGVNWNIAEQEYHLEHVFGSYLQELEPSPRMQMMSGIDRAVYYAMIRHYRPRKIIEVGGGESTRLAAQAVLMNQKEGSCWLACIEPYPNDDLVRGFDGLSTLIRARVQDVGLDEFADCELLFIDSSHVVKMGSDVVWEVLEILPRLPHGCLVHFHDIFMPREYPEEWARQRLFWSEQYLLWAFLLYNDTFKLLWGAQFMNLKNKTRLEAVFGEHARADYPLSSVWLQRTS